MQRSHKWYKLQGTLIVTKLWGDGRTGGMGGETVETVGSTHFIGRNTSAYASSLPGPFK